MRAEAGDVQPRCSTCGGPLVNIGSPEAGITEVDVRRRHAYWCPAGCRGPEPDGTFEFFECPSCGSRDTFSSPRGDGVEEVECNACGTISSLQIAAADQREMT
ncbi:MAG: hypothetical protein EHM55_04480 [Acidobacteria bacterium]|nr:MAG: hypothetical protein EHM55_04480 [Acidobacteriota bacterium]